MVKGLDLSRVFRLHFLGAGSFIKGHAEIGGDSRSRIYYLLYQAKTGNDKPENLPVILVLDGTPLWFRLSFAAGFSTLVQDFLMYGPAGLQVDEQKKITEKDRTPSWNDNYNLLFIDQPIGVGYSLSFKDDDIPGTLADATTQLYQALLDMFSGSEANKLTKFLKSDLYIFSRELGSLHAVSLANMITSKNADAKVKFNLQGVMVSDPWIDPIAQISDLPLNAYALGLIDHVERVRLESLVVLCTQQLMAGNFEAATATYSKLTDTLATSGKRPDLRNYRATSNQLDYTTLNDYLTAAAQLNTYSVDATPFKLFNPTVNKKMLQEYVKSGSKAFVTLLDSNLDVLVISSQDNAVIHAAGVSKALQSLGWVSQKQFNEQTFEQFSVSGAVSGSQKTAGSLSHVIVNKAGGYIPLDQMKVSIAVLQQFIGN
jgi:carboxypeptidase C (cathepsin A)